MTAEFDSPTQSRRRLLILGYHAVSPMRRGHAAVSESDLRSHLGYLKGRGYAGLTISEAERRRADGTLPSRSVVVTFDDGYASTLRAVPVLKEYGFPGTVFVVTSFVETGATLAWEGLEEAPGSDSVEELRSLTWEDVVELAGQGWEIGSHTTTHPLLTRASDERLRDELVQSRAAIERRLDRCSAIAYPYGLADDRVAEAARQAGYTVGCTLTFVHSLDEPLRRPRIWMGADHSRVVLTLKVSRFGQAARRSRPARLARAMRRRRDWLPEA